VAQARATNDPRLPQLERALGAARAADERRANIERLTIERATAAPEAASAANVTDTVGQELNTFAQYVEVWRPPFIAVICTLIGIFGAWWVLALMQGLNPRDVMRSGWADEAHRIEDLRDEPSVVPQPMKPQREAIFDGETGEELAPVNYPKFRKKPQKGKRVKAETKPDILPDETGVDHDGGGRVGSVGPAPADQGAESAAEQVAHDDNSDQLSVAEASVGVEPVYPEVEQPISPDYSDEELAAIERELATAENEPVDNEDASANANNEAEEEERQPEASDENVLDDAQDTPPREPETNPARMIAAE
jgi:hypothetical protein